MITLSFCRLFPSRIDLGKMPKVKSAFADLQIKNKCQHFTYMIWQLTMKIASFEHRPNMNAIRSDDANKLNVILAYDKYDDDNNKRYSQPNYNDIQFSICILYV